MGWLYLNRGGHQGWRWRSLLTGGGFPFLWGSRTRSWGNPFSRWCTTACFHHVCKRKMKQRGMEMYLEKEWLGLEVLVVWNRKRNNLKWKEIKGIRMVKTVSKKKLNQTGNKIVPTKRCLFRPIAIENLSLSKIPSFYFFILLKIKLKGHNLQDNIPTYSQQ